MRVRACGLGRLMSEGMDRTLEETRGVCADGEPTIPAPSSVSPATRGTR